MLENGMFLIDRYEILSKVGAGGMSDVYKAKDHILGRTVAIKVMKAEFSEDVNFVTKFRSEAQSAAGLEHPNIVNIYDVGSENGLHFIVMEYVEGITLKTYIEKKGQLSFKEATSIAIQVARGIEAAHSKDIIHRDIKPQNIIISTEGKVKVTDFGIARAISSNTISAEVMGSVHYASPEQARNGFVDGRSDIYSLGIVMYEMVTGRVPFDGDTTVSVAIQHLQEEMVEPSAYAPELPISYEKIVLKATQKNPDRRYQTIEELLADLRKALANPEEDFVVIAPAAVAKTRVIGGEELEEIKNSAANADLESENAYAASQDEDDAYDDYDEDDDEEDDTSGFLNPKLDKAVNIALIAVAVLIVAIIIWLCVSVLDLFKPGNSENTKNPPVSSSQTETESDSETDSTGETDTEETVKMVSILGWNIDQAEEYLEALGLGINIIANDSSSTEPDGTILNQDQAEGAMIPKGTVVNVVVAGDNGSVSQIAVPNVVGLNEEAARRMLESDGFKMEIDYVTSDTVEAGLIVSQTPEADTKEKQGTTVIVYISEGKAPVEVPDNLVGQTQNVAEYALKNEGFAVNIIEEYSADITKGTVISVSGAGTKLPYGSTIDVRVSAGPEPSTETETETESGNTEEKTTYAYNGVDIQAPEGASLYTYALYDAVGNVLKEETNHQKVSETDGKISISVKGLEVSSGKIVISWYEETEAGEINKLTEVYEEEVTFTEES